MKRPREDQPASTTAQALCVTITGGSGIPMEFNTADKAMAVTRKRLERTTKDQLETLIGLLDRAQAGERSDVITGDWNERAAELLTSARAKLAGLAETLQQQQAQQAREQELATANRAVGLALAIALGQRSGPRRVSVAPPGSATRPAARSALTPKDTSARPSVLHMAFTRGDEIGAARSMQLISDVASFAGPLGFTVRVAARTSDGPQWPQGQPQGVALAILADTVDLTGWAEDSGEFRANGTIAVPAVVDSAIATRAIEEDRLKRGYTSPTDRSTEAYLTVSRIGNAMAQQAKWREKIALAGVLNATAGTLTSHIEGGNLLTGSYQDGTPYVLVGRDGFAVTVAVCGNDKAALNAIAADAGVDPAQVFVIEQPGQYHLDMGMLIIGNGIVAVNDSMIVMDVMRRHIEQVRDRLIQEASAMTFTATQVTLVCGDILTKLETTLRLTAAYEQKAVEDLRRARPVLTIERVGGVFPPTAFTPRMNFLNGEIGTTAGGAGFLITNGGLSWAEDAVAAQYARISGGLLQTIVFTSPGAAAASLDHGGGIGCRVKSFSPAPDPT